MCMNRSEGVYSLKRMAVSVCKHIYDLLFTRQKKSRKIIKPSFLGSFGCGEGSAAAAAEFIAATDDGHSISTR